MPVTEFAVLEALPPYAVDSAPIQSFLADVGRQQASWSGYPLMFFRDTVSPTHVYLVSGWKDVPAHNVWIASEPNQELLRRAASILAVREFFHLGIDFETMPVGVQRMTWEVSLRGHAGAESDAETVTGGRWNMVWEGAGPVLEQDSGDIHRLRGYDIVEGKEEEELEIGQRLEEEQGSVATGSRAKYLHRITLPGSE